MDLRDQFAEWRTQLAVERTLLAYTRTAIGALAAGVGFLIIFEQVIFSTIGAIFIISSLVVFVLGWIRFLHLKKAIHRESLANAKNNHNN